jgi:hypothetical protein
MISSDEYDKDHVITVTPKLTQDITTAIVYAVNLLHDCREYHGLKDWEETQTEFSTTLKEFHSLVYPKGKQR